MVEGAFAGYDAGPATGVISLAGLSVVEGNTNAAGDDVEF